MSPHPPALERAAATAHSILVAVPLAVPPPAFAELIAGLMAIARRLPDAAPMVESILARTAATIDFEAAA